MLRCRSGHPAQKALHIVVTSPLTALADAVSADREGLLKNIGGIYIQVGVGGGSSSGARQLVPQTEKGMLSTSILQSTFGY
jgi:hypothetical protein